MKILFCTNAYEVVSNGPAKFAHLLLKINELYPQHEIKILTEDITNPDEQSVYKQTLRIPKMYRKLGMFLRMFQYHRRAMEIKRNDFNFDHLVYNNAIVALWSGLKFKNTVGFINDDNNSNISWKKGIFGFKWSKPHLFFLVEKLACRSCNKIVVNSQYLLKELTTKYKIPRHKIFLLYKSIAPVNKVSRTENAIPVILFVKNDYIRGGLFTLIDALKELKINVHLIIAGIADPEIPRIIHYLRNVSFQYNLNGIIKQQEVFELMKRADIFCVPSFQEALGVANIEAMAHGCSIISSNSGGIPEVLDNGSCGWMIEAGHVSQLKEAIKECLNNETLREEKKSNALKMINKFQLELMLQNFLTIISVNGKSA